MGLGLMLLVVSGAYLRTKDPKWRQLAFFWTKVYGLIFALGVATGVVQEFEFGMNWADYSRFVGNVFGSLLAAEGVFAFFLEGGFLGLMLFGGNRLGPKLWFFATFMVVFGAHFSALWIVMANSWMQTPQGYEVVSDPAPARAVMTDFWQVVWTPSFLPRLLHVFVASWTAGSALMLSVSAWYLLKKRHLELARANLIPGPAVLHRVRDHERGCLRRQHGHRGHPRTAASSSRRWKVCGRARRVRRCTSSAGSTWRRRRRTASRSRACSACWRTSTRRPTSQGSTTSRASRMPPIDLLFQVYHLMFGLGTLFAGDRAAGWPLLLPQAGEEG